MKPIIKLYVVYSIGFVLRLLVIYTLAFLLQAM